MHSTRPFLTAALLLGVGCSGQSATDRASGPVTPAASSAGGAVATAGARNTMQQVTPPSASGGSSADQPGPSGSGGGSSADLDAGAGTGGAAGGAVGGAGAGTGGAVGGAGAGTGGAAGGAAGGAPSVDTGANPGAIQNCTATGAQWCTGLTGGSLLEYASSIARDPQGNLVILGRTLGSIAGTSHGSFDTFVAKYTADGRLLWVKQFGEAWREIPGSIAADGSGNIVFGYRGDLNVDGYLTAGFVMKLSPNGDPLWTRQLGTDVAGGVATDADGNVVVGGDQDGAILAKFSPSGDLLWTKPKLSGDVAVDAAGNIFVSGGNDNTGFVAKVSPSGALLWNKSALATAANAVDANGNVFCLGKSVVQRYSSAGTLVWEAPVDPHLFDVNDIALDANGNVFIIGMANDFTSPGYDGYVAKYGVNGEPLGGSALGMRGGFENLSLLATGNGQLFIAGPLLQGAFIAHMSM